jgi:hypothetical protein
MLHKKYQNKGFIQNPSLHIENSSLGINTISIVLSNRFKRKKTTLQIKIAGCRFLKYRIRKEYQK